MHSLTRLIGRGRELREVERLIGAHRLVTLTGTGGTGKTRLAAELANRLEARRDGGVAWVDLAPCNDPMHVAQQAAAALSLRETAGRGTAGALVDALRESDLLLILDNCEHLIGSCAELAATLLTHCPRLRVMTTSREPLGISGEQVWPVPPLALPSDGTTDVAAVATSEAVELFVDRAVAVDPSFTLGAHNAAAVVEICRRLDGIPLAIELAAARVRLLTPEQITGRLEDRFTILAGGSRATIPRHRTLRAAIDWSFALLSEQEQTLLARLSVFPCSFSLEAVEAICTGVAVLDLLGSLVDKSLVVSMTGGAAVRYQLLESIREYAAGRLGADEARELRRRHAATVLAMARDAAPDLITPSVALLDRLDWDHANVRAALSWSLEHEPDAIALPLAAVFRWYWYYRILWSEGLRWLTRVLERSTDRVSADRASVLSGAGTLAGYLGDLSAGRRQLEEGEAMDRALGDEQQLALTLSALAHVLATADEVDAAVARAEESVALARRAGSPYHVAYCLTNAAAFAAQRRGDLEQADRFLEEAEARWAEERHPLGLPLVLNARALLAIRRRDHDAAARFARAALRETRERRDLWFSSRSLRILAYTTTGDPARAARLIGAADGMLRSMTADMLLHERSEYERLMATLRETLSAEELEAALREASRMTFEQACDFALPSEEIELDGLLHVRDLGPLRITQGGKPLAAEGRARELLLFLLAHPEGRTREEIGVAFWPDASGEQLKNSFHVTLHRLRKILLRPDAIRSAGGRYRIDPAFPHVADSRRFETEMTAALRQGTPDRLDAALALYEGDFLQGEEVGEWCFPRRTALRELVLRGLFALGSRLESHGRHAEAAEAYARLIAREPLHEAAARQLMICRARLGHRAESLLVYRRLEERLREDLETVPTAETVTLYRRLKQNEGV